MFKSEYLTIAGTGVAALIFSSLYYSPLRFGNAWRAVDPMAAAAVKPSPVLAVVELIRTLVIAFVFAHLLSALDGAGWKNSVSLAFWLWFGFSVMMWVGAIMWEKTPWQVALIHSGDRLVKTL
jgi:hypothetical protein